MSRALSLYLWNAEVSAAFHLPLQAVEVSLRNRVSHALRSVFGDDWWQSDGFRQTADADRLANISECRAKIAARKAEFTEGRLIAELSFGFWSACLRKRYFPAVWSRKLRTTFPGLPPNLNNRQIAARADQAREFRNRVFHHEPIFDQDLSKEFSELQELLGWISPAMEAWISPQCRVNAALRAKP